MRAIVVLALLVAAGCRKETAPPDSAAPAVQAKEASETTATDAASTTPLAASSSSSSSAVPPSPAPAPVVLPSESALRAIFKDAKGIVAVAEGGQREAFALRTELAADRPLLVASFTKLWVAVAVLRLAARKELGLDDELRTHLPELRSKPWADSTVREVLGHVSRVPEFDSGFFSRTDVDFTHAAATLGKELSAAAERRGAWKYRNSEFAILGALLEAKGGASASAVLEKEVFSLAGMKHAGIVVKGRPADVDFVPMGRVRPENFFTAGNGYAAANDLLAFFEALEGDALLDAASKAVLFDGRPKHDQAALGCWAYPYGSADGGTTLLVERPGSFGNVKLVTVFYPELHRAGVFWTSQPLEVGKPRTKGSLAFNLAHALL